ncbi:MAG: class I SAM-dependent methyltransferase [Polyangiaceae bacterium]|nr:class I SAM-dependent methyltransferase [Polyangiaceae bacterium]
MSTQRASVSYTPEARLERARARARDLESLIGLRGRRVLEVGCGAGDLCDVLAKEYECRVVGLDVAAQADWREIGAHPRIELVQADIASDALPFESESFDRIVSFVAWEHIMHPWSALRSCQRLLKSDGKKYLYAWLYGSPLASHLYHMTDEPWPHLVYSPQELKAKHGLAELPWYYWCNRLSLQHYLFYFRQLGFLVTHQVLIQSELDPAQLEPHRPVLQQYPDFDLRTDAFQVVLEFDPASPRAPIEDPVYRLRSR